MISSASGAAALMVLRSRCRAVRNLAGTRAMYSSTVFGAGPTSGCMSVGPVRAALSVLLLDHGHTARSCLDPVLRTPYAPTDGGNLHPRGDLGHPRHGAQLVLPRHRR